MFLYLGERFKRKLILKVGYFCFYLRLLCWQVRRQQVLKTRFPRLRFFRLSQFQGSICRGKKYECIKAFPPSSRHLSERINFMLCQANVGIFFVCFFFPKRIFSEFYFRCYEFFSVHPRNDSK